MDPESLSSMSDEEFLALLEQALPAGAWPADQVFELLERGESLLAGRPELAATMAPEIADAKAVAESARKALAPMLNTLNATQKAVAKLASSVRPLQPLPRARVFDAEALERIASSSPAVRSLEIQKELVRLQQSLADSVVAIAANVPSKMQQRVTFWAAVVAAVAAVCGVALSAVGLVR